MKRTVQNIGTLAWVILLFFVPIFAGVKVNNFMIKHEINYNMPISISVGLLIFVMLAIISIFYAAFIVDDKYHDATLTS